MRDVLPIANACRRTEQPASKLILALECGGSDGNSGITANPALGVAADLVVASGGTAVLGETTEIYGAEHLLTRRAVRPEVGAKLIERIRWWEWYAGVFGADLNNNPSPGNKAGGLTTIYEKSLGALAKAGTSPLVDVVGFAEQVQGPGLVFMDTPGFDPVCTTGLVAGGANVLVFTTGRGSVLGLKPTPCIKLATNTPMFERMRDDMDIDAGTILDWRTGGERGSAVVRPDPRSRGRRADEKRSQRDRRGRVRPLAHRPDAMSLSPRRSPLLLAGIILAQTVWLVWFLFVPLPSTGASQIRRVHLFLEADTYLRQGLGNLSQIANLLERLPIVGASLLIASASVAVGSLVGRGLGFRAGLARIEQVALGFGLGSTILGVLTLVLGRTWGLNPVVVRVTLGLIVGVGVVVAGVTRGRRPQEPDGPERWSIGRMVGFGAIVGPFLVLMSLGAMLPTIEFDALEYHLQGPKEYFLDGRIRFLPHNVYTSMPAGVEMLHLLAMEVLGDWWLGALAGQEMVAWFAVAAAVLIGASATRISGSTRAGWFASLIYLTTPWIFRAGNTPFVEGPLCFFHAALVWVLVRLGSFRAGSASEHLSPVRTGLLVGLLAGGAMAIKYPALVSAVVPAALVVGVAAVRARSSRLVVGFLLGLGLVVGPWLAKNVSNTGNPVYPLAGTVFGGTEWDGTREARWQGAHGPKPVAVGLLASSIVDVAGRSDWQSALYVALVPLAWLGVTGRRSTTWLTLYAGYLFLTWWLLTHRLDRFWLPMLAPLAVLAGQGADTLGGWSRGASLWLAVLLAGSIGVNLTLCSTELAGPTAWTGDLATVREQTARDGTPSLARLDELLPADAYPLVIGQAGTFGLRHRPVYNTVFNQDLFESMAQGQPLHRLAERLTERGITHVYVDWGEIDRYRSSGNYGFTDFETPALFDALVREGLLGPGTPVGSRQVLYKVR